jgi:hypothetical protein
MLKALSSRIFPWLSFPFYDDLISDSTTSFGFSFTSFPFSFMLSYFFFFFSSTNGFSFEHIVSKDSKLPNLRQIIKSEMLKICLILLIL